MLVKRIRDVLAEIINYDQVGYVTHVNIGEAVRLIDDMLFHSLNSSNHTHGFLVAVDFDKAFDSVSPNFLFSVGFIWLWHIVLFLSENINTNISSSNIIRLGILISSEEYGREISCRPTCFWLLLKYCHTQ